MSDNEWEAAGRLKNNYYIYRIVEVDIEPKIGKIIRDPVAAESQRKLERTATGWKIKLRKSTKTRSNL